MCILWVYCIVTLNYPSFIIIILECLCFASNIHLWLVCTTPYHNYISPQYQKNLLDYINIIETPKQLKLTNYYDGISPFFFVSSKNNIQMDSLSKHFLFLFLRIFKYIISSHMFCAHKFIYHSTLLWRSFPYGTFFVFYLTWMI